VTRTTLAVPPRTRPLTALSGAAVAVASGDSKTTFVEGPIEVEWLNL
jgi:hypothetical protein